MIRECGKEFSQMILILVKDSIHTLINRSTKECKFVVFRLVLDGKNKRDLIKNDKKVVNML